jgi:hypothetical protein
LPYTSMKRLSSVAVLGGAAALCFQACLTPVRSIYVVDMTPAIEEGSRYRVDPVDDAVVYSQEGLQVRVRHVTDADLREDLPGLENPYVNHDIDYRLGYRPAAFTVFEVTIVNPTFPKVRMDPDRAVAMTSQGRTLDSYAINRTDADGGAHNFEAYFLARGVQTGDAQKLYLERMGKIRETIYHRHSPVFKGKSYSGYVVFPPLPPECNSVRLVLDDLITGFGIDEQPINRISLRFPFSVQQKVRTLGDDAITERRP